MSERSTGKKTIKSIQIRKKSATVVLSDGERFMLSFNAYSDMRLYEGKEISDEEYALLSQYAKEDEYYGYALSLLSKEAYTSYGIKQKLLKKGAEKDVAISIASRLVREGLIDDAEYAKTYAHDVADFRLYGKRKTMQKLKEKGISAEILKDIEFPEEEEVDRAIRYCAILNKKLSKYPSAKKEEKAYAMLLEKGFETDVARKAVEEALERTPEAMEQESLSKQFYIAKHKYQDVTPLGMRRKKIYSYLARKGYRPSQIYEIMEELSDED